MIVSHDHDEQTIIAQCTPRGNGAIALLRISGIDAISIADFMTVLKSGQKLTAVNSHTVHLGFIINAQGNHIDQVMFTCMHGPQTFTGQNTVEITCHNNPFIIEAIIQRAIEVAPELLKKENFLGVQF